MGRSTSESRVIDRVKLLHARAAHPQTRPEEAATAHSVLIQMLNQHRPGVRYCYAKGAELKVVPTKARNQQHAKQLFKAVTAHRAGSFSESQRVLDAGVAGPALKRGYLAFGRYGYYVFVPLKAVQILI